MNRKIKILLATHGDTVGTIAQAYGCCRNVVWKELCGIRISGNLRTFIATRWGLSRSQLMKITSSDSSVREAA